MSEQLLPGYKQTKVGVIPEDWEVSIIGDVTKIGSGKDYKHLECGKFPVYGTGGYMLSVNDYLYDGESVCIGRKGTIDSPIYLNCKFWTVDTLFYTYSFKNIIPKYLHLLFLQINWLKYNEASGVPSLSKSTIESIHIPVPPLKEQKKIAEILSTWDEAIAKQQQLIDQKHVFKKNIMQQIFSQKIRFKDDNGNDYPIWKENKLGNISNIRTGKKDLVNKVDNGCYPFYVRSENIERIDSYSYDGEAILIPGDGKIGEIYHYINGRFDYHQRVYKISNSVENLKFIYYYLRTSFYKHAINFTVKATVDSLRLPIIQSFIIGTPCLEEQAKIVNFISCVDDEVGKQTKILEQLKQQKKSLMQKLLTGLIRCKI